MRNIEKYFNSLPRSSNNLSLSAMKFILSKYNNFDTKLKFIHIAGTNGKGSTTEILNNILCLNGYSVGKYMSPHLIKYNERISINNINISDYELNTLIDELLPYIKEYELTSLNKFTLFELETIIALLYFYNNNVDVVILETGLGGLYDCTNAISNSVLSIITSISFDHMHILGNTLEKIAYQKAGIMKSNSNTLFIKQTNRINNIFIEQSRKLNNNLILLNSNEILNHTFDENYQYFDYKDLKKIKLNLKNICQTNNAILCIEAVNVLNSNGFNISESSLKNGLKTVIHKARFETLSKSPTVIYDGAHNESSISSLKHTIKMYFPTKEKIFIISLLNTKDTDVIINSLLEMEHSTFIFTSGNSNHSFVPKEELYQIALKYKKDSQKILTLELNESIQFVRKNIDSVSFIVGTFYLYADFKNLLTK